MQKPKSRLDEVLDRRAGSIEQTEVVALGRRRGHGLFIGWAIVTASLVIIAGGITGWRMLQTDREAPVPSRSPIQLRLEPAPDVASEPAPLEIRRLRDVPPPPQRLGEFSVLEAAPSGEGRVTFQTRYMDGDEFLGARMDARRRVPSMDQSDFPEPASGCGPTAILNWMLWWQNEGVLKKPVEGRTEEVRQRYLFTAIEREIYGLRGGRRAMSRGGTNVTEITAAMDRLAHRWSGGQVRLHSKRFDAPLRISDLLEFTHGLRSGILITRVVEDRGTGRLGGYHAVSLVAGDRSGALMINNWGERVYGTLRTEADGQYFYARTTEHPPLKVAYALCFVPFRPDSVSAIARLSDGSFQRQRSRATMRPGPRQASRPISRTPAAPATSSFQLSFVKRSHGGWIYRVRNPGPSARAVYLGSFQGRPSPGGRLRYPTQVRGAERRGGTFTTHGSIEKLVVPAGSFQYVWFQFDYLEAKNPTSLELVEVGRH